MKQILSIKIGGQAGQGVKSAGLMLAKTAVRSGYQIFTYTEYPSLIRGGHNLMQILISDEPVRAPSRKTDLVIALNQNTISRQGPELAAGCGIIFDADKNPDTTAVPAGVNHYPIPLAKLASEAGDSEILVNIIAVAAAIALAGGDFDRLTDVIRSEFGSKGEETVNMNLKAAESGFGFARNNFADKTSQGLNPRENPEKLLIVNGNEAAALGAIAGGVQLAAIYPMSPISNILHVLAAHQQQYGYIYKQPEDEIAAINMAIGAGFAGVRAMTATSGGGFALMTEGFGLAGMTETPVVIIEGMRPGPATGLPTWSGQGDLQFVLHAHQGDFPRIVLAPGDSQETFELTRQAFNLAEKYQTPVVVLIDKNICENDASFPVWDNSGYEVNRGKISTEFNPDFCRYAPSEDGISDRSFPGRGNFFSSSSYEHDEKGLDSEDAGNAVRQQNKRMKKLKTCRITDMPEPQLFGPAEAAVTLVSWGSNKGSILEAIRDMPEVNFLHLTWMNPFPAQAVREILGRAKYLIDIECNYSGQLADLIAQQTGIIITDRCLKYDGRPFWPEEIGEKINQVLHRQ